MMKRLPAIIFVLLGSLLFVSGRAVAVEYPQDAGSTVNASVNNPSVTPTTIPIVFLSPTPTPKGGVVSPTPAPGGAIYLSISGYASPYASIVMTSQNVFVRSAVADGKGNFYISDVHVDRGFTQFCLENVDFQRLGDSTTCFQIPPVTSTTSKTGIFLPPSLGLSNKKTTPFSFVFGFGYTMPGSKVTLEVSEGIILHATADKKGYYKIKIEKLAVGTYHLFAAANYQGKNSEKPSKTQELKSLSPTQAAKEQLFTSIWQFIKKFGWIVIPMLILIFILISKRARGRIKTFIRRTRERLKTPTKKDKHLHHYWFIGY